MNRKIIMVASALVLALSGLAATFAPHEILSYFGMPADGTLPLLVQLIGALYLSFAMMNWIAKDSLIGGIYNRPVAIANLLHFVMGALALGKAAGVDPGVMKTILSDGIAGSSVLALWKDLGPRWKGMLEPTPPGVTPPNMRKDLHLVLDLAHALGVPLYLGTQGSLVADAGAATGRDDPEL